MARALHPCSAALRWSLAALLVVPSILACDEDPALDPNLEWEPCDHGRELVDDACVGPADLASWLTATDGCAALIAEEPGSRWRLPTPAELSAFVRADPSIDPARRWTNAHSDEPDKRNHPLSVDHGGYAEDQEPNKRIRYRCVKD